MIRMIAIQVIASLIFAGCETKESSSIPTQPETIQTVDTTWNNSNAYQSFTDSRDGQSYKFIKIGMQTWMAQNLNYVVENSWCPAGTAANCSTYGRLYQWSSAMSLSKSYNSSLWSGVTPRTGICPSGWHVPSNTEWKRLRSFVDSATGGLRLKSKIFWSDNGNGTDQFGFRALPAGINSEPSVFSYFGQGAYFWSSTELNANEVWMLMLYSPRDDANISLINHKESGASIRCILD